MKGRRNGEERKAARKSGGIDCGTEEEREVVVVEGWEGGRGQR
jgi:hypothetical protein